MVLLPVVWPESLCLPPKPLKVCPLGGPLFLLVQGDFLLGFCFKTHLYLIPGFPLMISGQKYHES